MYKSEKLLKVKFLIDIAVCSQELEKFTLLLTLQELSVCPLPDQQRVMSLGFNKFLLFTCYTGHSKVYSVNLTGISLLKS